MRSVAIDFSSKVLIHLIKKGWLFQLLSKMFMQKTSYFTLLWENQSLFKVIINEVQINKNISTHFE